MSKVLLKKRLSSMSKAEIRGLVAELYEVKKEAKDYLDYWMNPDEDAKLEEYMKVIRLLEQWQNLCFAWLRMPADSQLSMEICGSRIMIL